MKASIVSDKTGCLHIFCGEPELSWNGSPLDELGREATIFIQNEQEIEYIEKLVHYEPLPLVTSNAEILAMLDAVPIAVLDEIGDTNGRSGLAFRITSSYVKYVSLDGAIRKLTKRWQRYSRLTPDQKRSIVKRNWGLFE